MVSQTQLRAGSSIRGASLQQNIRLREEKKRKEEEKKRIEQETKKLEEDVKTTISKIEEGKITSYEQIPESQRKYISIDESYFTERKKLEEQIKKQNDAIVKQNQLNLAIRVYSHQVSGGAREFQAIPDDIKKQAKEIVEGKERQRMRAEAYYIQSKYQDLNSLLKSVGVSSTQIDKLKASEIEKIKSTLDYSEKGKISVRDTTKLNSIVSKINNPQTYVAYKNVLTGDIVSAKESPSKLYVKTIVNDKGKEVLSPSVNKFSSKVLTDETKRYQDLGYTSTQAKVLAKESVAQGGVSFTQESAKKIIRDSKKQTFGIFSTPYVKEYIEDAQKKAEQKKQGLNYFTSMSGKTYDEWKSQFEETEDAKKKAEQLYKDISKQEVELKKLEYGNVDGDYWIGSDEDYEKYKELHEETEKNIEDYEKYKDIYSKEISFGLLGGGRKIPIGELSGNPFGDIATMISSSIKGDTNLSFGKAGEYFADKAKKQGIDTKIELTKPSYFGKKIGNFLEAKPKEQLSLLKNMFITNEPQVVIDLDKNIYRLATEEDSKKQTYIPSSSKDRIIINPKTIKKGFDVAGNIAGNILTYGIPLAGGLIYAGERVKEYERSGSIFNEFQKAPVQTSLDIGLVTFGLGSIGKSYLSKPIARETQEGLRLTTRGQEMFGRRVFKFKWNKQTRELEYGFINKPSKESLTLVEKKISTNQPNIDVVGKLGEDIYYSFEKIGKSEAITKNIVKYPKTITSKIAEEGRYVKVIGGDGKTIYLGNPYTKLGKIQRAKVIKRATEMGFNKKYIESQIKLRTPKYEKYTSEGLINIDKRIANLQFKQVKEQPKIIVDKELNLLSRGAKTRERISSGQRVLIGQKDGVGVVLQLIKEEEFVLLPKGKKKFVKGDISQSLSFGEAKKFGREGKAYYPSKTDFGNVLEKLPSSELRNVNFEKYLLQYSLGKKTRINKNILSVDTGTLLFKRDINVVKSKSFKGGFEGGGKKSSKEFLQQENLYQDILKQPIKENKIKSTIEKLQDTGEKVLPKLKEETSLPRFMEGAGAISIYEGTGQYEQYQESAISLPAVTQNIYQTQTKQEMQPISFETQAKVNILQPQIKIEQKQFTNIKEANALKDMIKNMSKISLVKKTALVEKAVIKQDVGLGVGIRSELRSLLKTSQQIKQVQKKTQSKSQKLKKLTKPKTKTLKTPKIIIPSLEGSKSKERKKETGLFKAIAKVFGKEKVIGVGTKQQAEKSLKEFLKKELSASGYLETGGKKVKAKELSLIGEEFRKSKVSPFLVVEKKEKRLRKGGTGKKVQVFRKSSKKNLFGL